VATVIATLHPQFVHAIPAGVGVAVRHQTVLGIQIAAIVEHATLQLFHPSVCVVVKVGWDQHALTLARMELKFLWIVGTVFVNQVGMVSVAMLCAAGMALTIIRVDYVFVIIFPDIGEPSVRIQDAQETDLVCQEHLHLAHVD